MNKRWLTKLRAIGVEVPTGATIQRTYAGHWQKSEGAWSAFLVDEGGRQICGWYEPIRALQTCPTLSVRDSPGGVSVECNCKSGCLRNYYANKLRGRFAKQ